MKTLLIKSFFVLFMLQVACSLVSNAQIQQNNIRIVDTVYTPPGYSGGALTSRLWLPSVTNGAAIILAHHAGGLPQDYSNYGDFFSSFGYVVISIDYYSFFHASGPPLYPDPVRAFKTGIEFLRKNAVTFGCYTGKVAGFGFSEGAMHWAETITWDNDDAYFNTDPSINDHLDAVICYYGLYDKLRHLESPFFSDEGNESLIADYFSPNPALRATKGNPIVNVANITTPVLLFHGTSDQVWNYQQSVEFNDSLLAHGKSSILKLLPGRDHIFDVRGSIDPLHFHMDHFSGDGEMARDTALAFISRTLQVTNIHCPFNKSYWKNHVADWNADALPMKLGSTNYYNQSQLLTMMNSSAGNDPVLKLAQELIAAKLNLGNNTVAVSIVSTIVASDQLIGNRSIPVIPAIATNSTQGIQMTALGNTLNAYNNGTLTPNCRNSGSRMDQNNSSPDFSLSIYPNPVLYTTTVSFTLTQAQKISLKIFDMNGKLVATLADKIFDTGENELKWNAEKMQAGVYLLQLQSVEKLLTEKLIVTR